MTAAEFLSRSGPREGIAYEDVALPLLVAVALLCVASLCLAVRMAAQSASKPDEYARTLTGAALALALELYDYSLYGFFADDIAKAYLPPTMGQRTQQLIVFTVFWGAFLMRPVGGLIFGYFGDSVGRAAPVRWTIGLMAMATIVIGAIPPYAWIGRAAPLLLLVARLMQGAALGGQFGGAVLLSLESAAEDRKGLVSSIILAIACAGNFAGSAVASIFKETGLAGSWYWRIPFVLVLAVSSVPAWLLWDEHETQELSRALDSKSPEERLNLPAVFAKYMGTILRIVAVGGVGQVTFFVAYVFVPTYLGGRQIGYAYSLSTICMGFCVIFTPCWGWFVDRWGRSFLPWQMMCGALCTAAAMPLVTALLERGSISSLVLGYLITNVVQGAIVAPLHLWNFDQVPDVLCRYSVIGIGYNIDVALFGGSAPDVAVLLTRNGGLPAAAPYLAGVGLLAAFTLCWHECTKGVKGAAPDGP